MKSFRVPKKKAYVPPSTEGYTIYSISGCKYCTKAKNILKEQKTTCKVVNCDNYVASLLEREAFYTFIKKYTVKSYIHFPMIFNKGKFIGGYKELFDAM